MKAVLPRRYLDRMADPLRPWQFWLWPLLLLVLLVGIWLMPWRGWIEPLRIWIEGHGATGWAVYILAYAVVVALPLPAVLMSVIGGISFGWWGVPLALIGSVAGALGPFYATRYWLRDPMLKRFGTPKVRTADELVRNNAALFVTLLRITPVLPFTVQNYLLGLTSVTLWPYLWATVAGLFPSTVAMVWLGTIGGLEAAGTDQTTVLTSLAGVCVLGLVILWLTRQAVRRLRHVGFIRRPSTRDRP